jgi:hypothetical protein
VVWNRKVASSRKQSRYRSRSPRPKAATRRAAVCRTSSVASARWVTGRPPPRRAPLGSGGRPGARRQAGRRSPAAPRSPWRHQPRSRRAQGVPGLGQGDSGKAHSSARWTTAARPRDTGRLTSERGSEQPRGAGVGGDAADRSPRKAPKHRISHDDQGGEHEGRPGAAERIGVGAGVVGGAEERHVGHQAEQHQRRVGEHHDLVDPTGDAVPNPRDRAASPDRPLDHRDP